MHSPCTASGVPGNQPASRSNGEELWASMSTARPQGHTAGQQCVVQRGPLQASRSTSRACAALQGRCEPLTLALHCWWRCMDGVLKFTNA
jgi:hypothetical protein